MTVNDALADFWGAEARRNVLVYPEEHVVRFLARTRPDRVANAGRRALEIGCGGGRNLVLLADHGLRPVGIDISVDAIDVASTLLDRAGIDADLRVSGYDTLAADRERFDVVLWDSPCLVAADELEAQMAIVAGLVEGDGVIWLKFRHPDTWFSTCGSHLDSGSILLDERANEYAGMSYAFLDEDAAERVVSAAGLEVIEAERCELWKHRATQRNVWTTVWARRP